MWVMPLTRTKHFIPGKGMLAVGLNLRLEKEGTNFRVKWKLGTVFEFN